MESTNKLVHATRKKFLSSENVLVVAKNQSRTVLLAQGSEEPRIYTNTQKLKLVEKVSVALKTDLTSESSPIITLNSHESSDVIAISKLPNLEQYPLCSAVWPVLVALAADIDKWDLNHGWSLVTLAPVLFHESLFSEYDSEDYSHPELVLLDAYRLGIGDELLPFISLSTEKGKWIASLAASANEDHEVAHELASTVSAIEYPQICIVQARSSEHGSSVLVKNKSEKVSGLETLYRGILNDDDLKANDLYNYLPELLSFYPDFFTDFDSKETFLKHLNDAKNGLVDNESTFMLNEIYGLLALAKESTCQAPFASDSFSNLTFASAPLSLIDLLINKSIITEADLSTLGASRPEDASYLWCRVSPETASKEHLIEEKFEYEIFRREFTKESSDLDNEIKIAMEKLGSGVLLTEKELDLFPTGLKEVAKDICKLIVTGFDESLTYLLEDETITERLSDRLLTHPSNTDGSTFKSDSLGKKYLRNSFDHLLAGEWEEAIDKAREVLRLTDDESLRDEALNLVACGYWQIGEDQKSITALETALEGEYNSALQVNIGIVAQHLDPVSAIDHLVDLATEAPTLELQFQVIQRAFSIWYQSEIEEEIPEKLQQTAHKLLQEMYGDKEFDDEHVWDLTWLLSSNERTLPVIDTTHLSPLRQNMLTIGKAHSEGLVEYIEAVGKLRGESEWISERKDSVISLVLNIQQVDITSAASGVLGMTLLETGIEIPVEKELRIHCFTIIGVCRSLVGNDGIPRQNLINQFVSSQELLEQLEPAAREDAKELLKFASDSLLRCLVVGAVPMIEEFQKIIFQLSSVPAHRARRSGSVAPIHDDAKKLKRNIWVVKDTLEKLGGSDPDLFDFSDELFNKISSITRIMGQYV